jgi:arsenate reductase
MRTLLFLGRLNACRTQMAEAFARHLLGAPAPPGGAGARGSVVGGAGPGGGQAGPPGPGRGEGDVRLYSAGLAPAGLDPRAALVMAEIGFSLSGHSAKGLGAVPLAEVDVLVTVGEEAEIDPSRVPAAAEWHHWPVVDPAGSGRTRIEVLEAYRRSRDDLRRHVEAFLQTVQKDA